MKAAAAARLAEDKARRDVTRYGGSLEIDPATALLQEVHRSAAAVAYLQARVNDLEQGDIIEVGAFGARSPNMLIQMYQQERDRLARVSKAALDAGCAQSLVDVFKQVGATYVQLVDRVLDRLVEGLELTDEQQGRAPELVREAFRTELDRVTGGREVA